MTATRTDGARAIRVVMFGSGPALTHESRRFLSRLEAHPDIDLVGAFVQAGSSSLRAVFQDLRKRRGVLALPLFAAWALGGLARNVRHPFAERSLRRALASMADRIHTVPDVHAPAVVERLRSLDPDLGVVYGSPILKADVFESPRLGTLGIHHGKVPKYRGNKTTFWAMWNGETVAGVTIQRLNAGLDRGEIVLEGAVGIGRRSLRAVWRDLENLGLDLYVRAILQVRSGTATYRPQTGKRGRLYRNPKAGDLLRFRWKRLRTRLGLAPDRSRSADGGRRPRVLIFTETFHPVVGGGETQARLLADGLNARGFEVRILTRRSDPSLARVESVDGVLVHRIAPAGRGQLKKWGLLPSSVPALIGLRRQYDVVFVSGFRIVGISTAILGPMLGKRTVMKADSRGEMSGAFFEGGLARFGVTPSALPFRMFLRFRNAILKRADAFVSITDEIAGELADAGVPSPDVHRVPNGVDTRRFSPIDPANRAALRERLGLPVTGKIVTYTGRLVSYKGLPLLVRVWEGIRRAHPDATLMLIGDGGLDIHNCEAELRATVAERGPDGGILFTGSVDNVAEFLQASDLFAFPTENDAFPCALVEAMACRLPVVTTPVGAIPSIVEHEREGLMVPPGDAAALDAALRRLLSDDRLAARLGDAAWRTVQERYAAETVTRKIEDLLVTLHD